MLQQTTTLGVFCVYMEYVLRAFAGSRLLSGRAGRRQACSVGYLRLVQAIIIIITTTTTTTTAAAMFERAVQLGRAITSCLRGSSSAAA